MDSSDLSDGPITLQEYLEVKKALASSEAKVQQLMKVNNNLSEELRRLQKEVGSMDDRRGRGSACAVTKCRAAEIAESGSGNFHLFMILFNNSGQQQETGKGGGKMQEKSV